MQAHRVENSTIKTTTKKRSTTMSMGNQTRVGIAPSFLVPHSAIVPSELAVSPLTFFGFVVVLSRL